LTSSRKLHYDAPLAAPGSVGPRAGVRVHALSAAAEKALDTLVDGFATADHLRSLGGITLRPDVVTPELVLQRLPFGEEAVAELRRLAEELLRHALGDARAPNEETLALLSEALAGALGRVGEVEGKHAAGYPRPKGVGRGLGRVERERLFADVGELLREVALEVLDVYVAFSPRQGSEPPRVAVQPVSPTAAHVNLLERLLARLEASILGHELLQLEREASRWWFRRWSAEPPPEGARARSHRELEWSLAERGTLYMGPVLDNFVGRGFAQAIPPRQQRLAQAMQSSFAGVFQVTARRDEITVFKDAESGRRVEVMEHNPALAYESGWIGLGRLYAFDGPYHVRSSGMAFLESRGDAVSDAVAAQLADSLKRGRRQLAGALAVEALVTALTGDSVPRPVPAARSYVEAQKLVERATHALAAAGLVEDGVEESAEAVEAAGAAEGEAVPVRRYKVDSTMGQWLTALFELTKDLPRPGPARARVGAKSKGKTKRRGK
jgi:hypothetical protein